MSKEHFYNALKFHGAEAVMGYIRAQPDDTPKEIMQKIICKCLPLNDEEHFSVPERNKAFISFFVEHADELFNYTKHDEQLSINDTEANEKFGVLPPLDHYLNAPRIERWKSYVLTLGKFDIMIGRISKDCPEEKMYETAVLCFYVGKCRKIEDLGHTMWIKYDDAMTALKVGDIVRAALYTCDIMNKQLFLTMDHSKVTFKHEPVELGVIAEDDLPLHYKLMRDFPNKTISEYEREKNFRQKDAFRDHMKALNIDMKKIYSFTSYVKGFDVRKENCISSIRAKRHANLSRKCCQKAKTYFADGDIKSAFASVNEALKYNPENVDALVNRAALYANNDNYNPAIADLESALSLDPSYSKAQSHLCEILDLLGNKFYKEYDFHRARKCYGRMLQIRTYDIRIQEAYLRSIAREFLFLQFGSRKFQIQVKPIEKKEVVEGNSGDIYDVQPMDISPRSVHSDIDSQTLEELVAKEEAILKQIGDGWSPPSSSKTDDTDREEEKSKYEFLSNVKTKKHKSHKSHHARSESRHKHKKRRKRSIEDSSRKNQYYDLDKPKKFRATDHGASTSGVPKKDMPQALEILNELTQFIDTEKNKPTTSK